MTIRLRSAIRASACPPPRVRRPRVLTRRAEVSAPSARRALIASWAILPASILLVSVWTAPSKADPQTFDEALARAAAGAPGLRASALGVDAARAAARAAGRLPDPRLTFGLDGFPVTGPFTGQFDQDDFTMLRIGVEQDVPSRTKKARATSISNSWTICMSRAVDRIWSRSDRSSCSRRSSGSAWGLFCRL